MAASSSLLLALPSDVWDLGASLPATTTAHATRQNDNFGDDTHSLRDIRGFLFHCPAYFERFLRTFSVKIKPKKNPVFAPAAQC